MRQDPEHRIRRYINAAFRQVSKPGLQQAQPDQSGSLGVQYPGAHTRRLRKPLTIAAAASGCRTNGC